MKTLRTYPTLIPAQLAQSRLRAAGIEAILPDEASATAGYAGFVGGVRVQVHEEDVEAAESVLSEDGDLLD